MTIEALTYINNILSSLMNYEFGQWSTSPVPYPYFVGEYNEAGEENEDGQNETTFILTGTNRGSMLELEKVKAKVRKVFKEKQTAILPNGNGIAVFYSNGFTVPTDNGELKRIQINLQVKEWKVT